MISPEAAAPQQARVRRREAAARDVLGVAQVQELRGHLAAGVLQDLVHAAGERVQEVVRPALAAGSEDPQPGPRADHDAGDRGARDVDGDAELEALLVPGDLGQGHQEPVGRDRVEVGVAHVRTIPPRECAGAQTSGVGCEPHDNSIHIHARGGGSRSESGADPQP